MPTINPRVAITVPPHRHDLLKRLAALQGVSMAGLVTDLLNEFYPVLERVCVALEMAKKAQATTKTGIREAAEKAQAEIQPMLAESMNQFDLFMKHLEVSVIEPKEVETESVSPRVVTRGSGIKNNKPSKPVKASDIKGSGVIERRDSRK